MQTAFNAPSGWRQTPLPRFRTWFSSAVLIGLGAPLLGRGLLAVSRSIFAENGTIETLQACLLVAAFALFLSAHIRSTGAKAAFCVLMAVVSLLAVQREVPACQSAFYEGGICLTRTAKWVLSTLAIAAGLGLFRLKNVSRRSLLNPRNAAWIWPVAVAAILLGLAEFAEHLTHQEMEETLEFGAYAYLATYALWVGRTTTP